MINVFLQNREGEKGGEKGKAGWAANDIVLSRSAYLIFFFPSGKQAACLIPYILVIVGDAPCLKNLGSISMFNRPALCSPRQH